MSEILELTQALIARRSVTPDDAGCQELLAERLSAAGFRIERLRFGAVDNLWARFGDSEPVLAFAGHTDVVPPGPIEQWRHDPFTPVVEDGMLYGRGAADMKGAVAAMTIAAVRFAQAHPDCNGSVALLITSDEEGDAIDGTVKVVERLQARGERIRWCLVGEPSSSERLGDVMKNGRRGSLTGHLRIHGVQGHVAYPERGDNPIHRALPALHALCEHEWDQGNDDFPPTTLQISNFNAGTGADNVIPAAADVVFNLRFNTHWSAARLQPAVEEILRAHGLKYTLRWHSSGEPFLTRGGELTEAMRAAVREVAGIEPQLSTAGGTSDGRFIAPTGAQVVELGPVNATIHKIDECVAVADLDRLGAMYERVMERLLLTGT